MTLHRDISRGASAFSIAMREHLERVSAANAQGVRAAAELILTTIRRDGIVHVAGTGHSTVMLLETFFRAGGLACIRPVHHPALNPLFGAGVATFLERQPGLASLLVESSGPGPDDMMIVFSNSGANPVPVETAESFAGRGLPIVGVMSRTHNARAPRRTETSLIESATVLLDTAAPYGDAAYQQGGASVAGMSTLCSVYLWNSILAELAMIADEAGVVLPVWISANTDSGGDENAALVRQYAARVPML